MKCVDSPRNGIALDAALWPGPNQNEEAKLWITAMSLRRSRERVSVLQEQCRKCLNKFIQGEGGAIGHSKPSFQVGQSRRRFQRFLEVMGTVVIRGQLDSLRTAFRKTLRTSGTGVANLLHSNIKEEKLKIEERKCRNKRQSSG
jgi:hypothetical protein